MRYSSEVEQKYQEHLFVNDGCVNEETKQRFKNTKRTCTGYIYFVQGSLGGAIKIGFTTDPENRIKTLQTGYPDTLRILLIIRGNMYTEKFIHKKLITSKLKGEWFKPDDTVLDQIKYFKGVFPGYKSFPNGEPK